MSGQIPSIGSSSSPGTGANSPSIRAHRREVVRQPGTSSPPRRLCAWPPRYQAVVLAHRTGPLGGSVNGLSVHYRVRRGRVHDPLHGRALRKARAGRADRDPARTTETLRQTRRPSAGPVLPGMTPERTLESEDVRSLVASHVWEFFGSVMKRLRWTRWIPPFPLKRRGQATGLSAGPVFRNDPSASAYYERSANWSPRYSLWPCRSLRRKALTGEQPTTSGWEPLS